MKTQINEAFILRRKSFTNNFIISDKFSSLLGLAITSYFPFMDGLLVYLMRVFQLEVLALCRV
jgi:hypothetical protein